jgi:hypothetical protein
LLCKGKPPKGSKGKPPKGSKGKPPKGSKGKRSSKASKAHKSFV